MPGTADNRIGYRFRSRAAAAALLWAAAVPIPPYAQDTLLVGAGRPHPTLRSALAAARDGDIIRIGAGLYKEKGLVAERRVSIRGEGWPVLDAEGGITILDIRAPGVEVRGLVFRNVGVNYIKEHAAVWISEAPDAVIAGNRFERNFFGVYGSHVRRARIEDNAFTGLEGRETSNGNGVHFWKSDSVAIKGNSIKGQRDGIYLEFTGNSDVTGNTCESNVRYGLHFMYSNGNLYRANTFRSNGSGVAVMYSHDVDMRENLFERNWGAASYGLLLKAITGSRIRGNRFDRNTVAIFQEASNRLDVSGNTFTSNGWALRIVADCDANVFAGNRFRGNTFDVAYNASPFSTNSFRGNAWDHYQGWDLDHDGVGDVPHRPVELFPAIMQNHPQAMALLRSHFVTLLNVLERMFPTLSPATLEDREPAMMAGAATDRKAR
jgi:nitrous oxidase accessory protein